MVRRIRDNRGGNGSRRREEGKNEEEQRALFLGPALLL